MKDIKIKNKGSKVLFDNPLLERISRTHFAVPVVLFYLISIGLIVYTAIKLDNVSWLDQLLLFPLGFLVFTLVEYLIHRYLFHFEPKNDKQKKMMYSMHGVHHEFPRDKDRLAMPIPMALIIATVFFFVFNLLLGPKVFAFIPGFYFGYSTYLFVHYAVHALRPPNNFLKILWTHHSLHHYKDENTAFSVSVPLWDYLFSSMPQREKPVDRAAEKLPDYNLPS
ncbi:MAG TPA: sterol desaturase family protein [Bacteroidia bacterium]|nr:sterol desaturase family protein [Bacteroidia bacterium]